MSFKRNQGTTKALFSTTDDRPSGDDWATPQAFYDRMHAEYHFTLDACATAENAKAPCYITQQDDALAVAWTGRTDGNRVWCNPPYGKDVGRWLAKGRAEAERGCLVVFLIHARTDTRRFHEHVYGIADEIRFIKGRLRFTQSDGKTGSAPFPSMIVVYRPKARTAAGQ